MKPVSKSRTVWTTTVLAPLVAWAGATFGLTPETQAMLMLVVPAAVAAFRASDIRAAAIKGAARLESAEDVEAVALKLLAEGHAEGGRLMHASRGLK